MSLLNCSLSNPHFLSWHSGGTLYPMDISSLTLTICEPNSKKKKRKSNGHMQMFMDLLLSQKQNNKLNKYKLCSFMICSTGILKLKKKCFYKTQTDPSWSISQLRCKTNYMHNTGIKQTRCVCDTIALSDRSPGSKVKNYNTWKCLT